MILSLWGPAYIPAPAVGFGEASSNNTSSCTLYKLWLWHWVYPRPTSSQIYYDNLFIFMRVLYEAALSAGIVVPRSIYSWITPAKYMAIGPFHKAPKRNPPRRWKGTLTGEWGSGHCVSWQISWQIFFSWIFVSLWLIVGFGAWWFGIRIGVPGCNNPFHKARVILGIQTIGPRTISWLRDKGSRCLISWCLRFSRLLRAFWGWQTYDDIFIYLYNICRNPPVANNQPGQIGGLPRFPPVTKCLVWLPAAHLGK